MAEAGAGKAVSAATADANGRQQDVRSASPSNSYGSVTTTTSGGDDEEVGNGEKEVGGGGHPLVATTAGAGGRGGWPSRQPGEATDLPPPGRR